MVDSSDRQCNPLVSFSGLYASVGIFFVYVNLDVLSDLAIVILNHTISY